MSDMELTPEDSERVKELRRALEEEFLKGSDPNARKSALQDLEDLKTDFLEGLRHCARHGSDTLKAKVSMWGYDKLLDQGKASTDTLEKLFESMPTSHD